MVSNCGASNSLKYTYISYSTSLLSPHYRSLFRHCCCSTLFFPALRIVAIVRESRTHCKAFISTTHKPLMHIYNYLIISFHSLVVSKFLLFPSYVYLLLIKCNDSKNLMKFVDYRVFRIKID